MSAELPVLVRSFRVGARTCTVTIPRIAGTRAPVSMLVEWSPDIPRNLSAAEWAQYRLGRDAAIREVADLLGGTALVVEV